MKIKTLVAVLFLSAGATTVVAQDDANCNSNSSISHEAVKAGNFKDAYTPWKAVLENCPTLRFYTFTDGYKILKGLLGQIKDRNSAEYKKYFDELMNTHDLRMKYTQEFLGKGVKVSSEDEALGIKAVDYIAFAPKVDVNQAYDWLKKSVDAAKAESAAATLFYFLQMSHDKLKEDPAHKEQFILKGLLGQIKDRNSAEYKKYFDELMNTHDLRMKYTQEFLGKGVKVSSEDEALGIKAVDYIAFAPKVDVNQAYDWLKKSVDAAKAESAAATLFYFLQMSHDKLKEDPAHKEQFIQDYLAASEYADDAIAAADKESVKKAFGGIKDNLVALFINSGTADCESLQGIYGPKVETNQTDLNYLKKVISIMKMMKCTDSDAYQQASFYVYKIEPSAEAATGCAYQAYKKGDIDGSVKFFDEAINLETDNAKKAEKAYAAASVLTTAKKLSQARSYAQKAISFNENYGAPYILIANLYAMSPNWSDESALNKCTYFAVIDKLQKAKSVDPSVTEEVNKMISRYSAYTPQAKDLFMLGYKAGDRITIGGWIGESTTIR